MKYFPNIYGLKHCYNSFLAKLFLILTVFLIPLIVCAQHNNNINFVNIPANPVSTKLPVFNNYEPVLSSGMINMPIDIFNIDLGNFQLPLKLVYSTSGITIENSPLPYGYGWSLNLNPRVTRRLMGRKDEAFPYKSSYEAMDSDWGSRNSPNVGNYGEFYEPLKAIVDENSGIGHYQLKENDFYDSQKDIFSIQLPNKIVPFILIYKNGGYEPKAYNSNVKIEIVKTRYDITGLKVTDEDGTQFIFGNINNENTTSYLEVNGNVISAWLLREIILLNKQKISFSWIEKNISTTKPSIAQPLTLMDYKSGDFEDGTLNSPVIGEYGGIINLAQYGNNYVKMLNSISFMNGEVIFDYKTTSEPFINSIQVRDSKRNLINNTAFSFGAKNAQMEYLLLQSLKINNQIYSFQYNSNRFDKASPEIDFWGFFNGKGQLNQVPKVNLNYFGNYSPLSDLVAPLGTPIGYSDKTVDSNKMKAFMLERINLPTGGYVLYTYEPHKFVYSESYPGFSTIPETPSQGGGLRVRSINFYNANNLLQFEKNYKYGRNENGLANIKMVPTLNSFIDENYVFTYTVSSNGSNSKNNALSSRLVAIKSLSDYNAYDFGNSGFWYDQVTEYSNGSKRNLYFEYQDDEVSNLVATKLFNKKFTWSVHTVFQSGPQVKREEIFKSSGSRYDTLSIKEYENDFYMFKEDLPIKNMLVDRKITASFIGGVTGGTDPIYPSDVTKFPNHYPDRFSFNVAPYYIYPIVPRLKSVNTIDFTITGKIQNKKEYVYATSKPLSVIQINNKLSKERDSLVTIYKYPWDYSSLIAKSMVLKNMLAVPLEIQTIKNTSKTLERNNFSEDLVLTNGLTLLSKKEQLINNNVSDQYQVLKFDKYGNALEVLNKSGMYTSFIWGYSGAHLIANLVNTRYNEVITSLGINSDDILNNLNRADVPEEYVQQIISNVRNVLKSKMITSYTYKALIGVASKTDFRGVSEFYEYDNYGRLICVKDFNNNVVKTFCYNLAGEMVDCSKGINIFSNDSKWKDFYKNNCPNGLGERVRYQVIQGKYTSTTSKDDANAKAQFDIDINGQNYANQYGTCQLDLVDMPISFYTDWNGQVSKLSFYKNNETTPFYEAFPQNSGGNFSAKVPYGEFTRVRIDVNGTNTPYNGYLSLSNANGNPCDEIGFSSKEINFYNVKFIQGKMIGLTVAEYCL